MKQADKIFTWRNQCSVKQIDYSLLEKMIYEMNILNPVIKITITEDKTKKMIS